MDLAERGKTQAKIVNEQTKLAKAQRQLGALVYSLAKGNEENQPLVDKYIEMIDAIEKDLADLRASLDTPAAEAAAEPEAPLRPRARPSSSPSSRSRKQKRRPAPSAALPFRRMRCSATSAAHSCDQNRKIKAQTGRCPRGMPPVFVPKCEKSGNISGEWSENGLVPLKKADSAIQ